MFISLAIGTTIVAVFLTIFLVGAKAIHPSPSQIEGGGVIIFLIWLAAAIAWLTWLIN